MTNARTLKLVPITLILIGLALILMATMAVGGLSTAKTQAELGKSQPVKYGQLTLYKGPYSNGNSPCGYTKSSPPPTTPATGGANQQCKPTATPRSSH